MPTASSALSPSFYINRHISRLNHREAPYSFSAHSYASAAATTTPQVSAHHHHGQGAWDEYSQSGVGRPMRGGPSTDATAASGGGRQHGYQQTGEDLRTPTRPLLQAAAQTATSHGAVTTAVGGGGGYSMPPMAHGGGYYDEDGVLEERRGAWAGTPRTPRGGMTKGETPPRADHHAAPPSHHHLTTTTAPLERYHTKEALLSTIKGRLQIVYDARRITREEFVAIAKNTYRILLGGGGGGAVTSSADGTAPSAVGTSWTDQFVDTALKLQLELLGVMWPPSGGAAAGGGQSVVVGFIGSARRTPSRRDGRGDNTPNRGKVGAAAGGQRTPSRSIPISIATTTDVSGPNSRAHSAVSSACTSRSASVQIIEVGGEETITANTTATVQHTARAHHTNGGWPSLPQRAERYDTLHVAEGDTPLGKLAGQRTQPPSPDAMPTAAARKTREGAANKRRSTSAAVNDRLQALRLQHRQLAASSTNTSVNPSIGRSSAPASRAHSLLHSEYDGGYGDTSSYHLLGDGVISKGAAVVGPRQQPPMTAALANAIAELSLKEATFRVRVTDAEGDARTALQGLCLRRLLEMVAAAQQQLSSKQQQQPHADANDTFRTKRVLSDADCDSDIDLGDEDGDECPIPSSPPPTQHALVHGTPQGKGGAPPPPLTSLLSPPPSYASVAFGGGGGDSNRRVGKEEASLPTRNAHQRDSSVASARAKSLDRSKGAGGGWMLPGRSAGTPRSSSLPAGSGNSRTAGNASHSSPHSMRPSLYAAAGGGHQHETAPNSRGTSAEGIPGDDGTMAAMGEEQGAYYPTAGAVHASLVGAPYVSPYRQVVVDGHRIGAGISHRGAVVAGPHHFADPYGPVMGAAGVVGRPTTPLRTAHGGGSAVRPNNANRHTPTRTTSSTAQRRQQGSPRTTPSRRGRGVTTTTPIRPPITAKASRATHYPTREDVVEFVRTLLQPAYNSGMLPPDAFAAIVRHVSAELQQHGIPAGYPWQDVVAMHVHEGCEGIGLMDMV